MNLCYILLRNLIGFFFKINLNSFKTMIGDLDWPVKTSKQKWFFFFLLLRSIFAVATSHYFIEVGGVTLNAWFSSNHTAACWCSQGPWQQIDYRVDTLCYLPHCKKIWLPPFTHNTIGRIAVVDLTRADAGELLFDKHSGEQILIRSCSRTSRKKNKAVPFISSHLILPPLLQAGEQADQVRPDHRLQLVMGDP